MLQLSMRIVPVLAELAILGDSRPPRRAFHRADDVHFKSRQHGLETEYPENEIRTRNRSVEHNLATVDPGDGQSKRLAADEIGELRLSGVQDFVPGATCIFDQVAKQRTVGLVAFRPLCRAHQVEVSLQTVSAPTDHRRCEHHRQPVAA